MKPKKQVLLCCSEEFEAARLKLVMETRLYIRVTITEGLGIVTAVRKCRPHCAVLDHSNPEVIDFLRARDIPTLEIGQGPSYADRCVSGPMMDVLEAVKIMCARKRGPKVRAA